VTLDLTDEERALVNKLEGLYLNNTHWIDVKIRRNGQDEYHQADWLKYIARAFIKLQARAMKAEYDLHGYPYVKTPGWTNRADAMVNWKAEQWLEAAERLLNGNE